MGGRSGRPRHARRRGQHGAVDGDVGPCRRGGAPSAPPGRRPPATPRVRQDLAAALAMADKPDEAASCCCASCAEEIDLAIAGYRALPDAASPAALPRPAPQAVRPPPAAAPAATADAGPGTRRPQHRAAARTEPGCASGSPQPRQLNMMHDGKSGSPPVTRPAPSRRRRQVAEHGNRTEAERRGEVKSGASRILSRHAASVWHISLAAHIPDCRSVARPSAGRRPAPLRRAPGCGRRLPGTWREYDPPAMNLPMLIAERLDRISPARPSPSPPRRGR